MTDTAVEPATTEVEQWLARFDQALTAGDSAAAAELFLDDSYWRDLVAFTWNLKTVEGPAGVKDMLDHTLAHTQAARLGHDRAARRGRGRDRGVDRVRDRGRPRQGPSAPQGRQGVDAADHALRAQGPRGARPAPAARWAPSTAPTRSARRGSSSSEREARELGYETQPEVVIVGGGQGGIALAARLRQLRVPTIVVERNERPGDSWRKRYKSLCLHDPVWYDHLPYIKFPENWPVFSPKDKIGDWLEMYTRVMELNYWSSTEAKSAKYDEEAGEWVVVVEREGAEITLRPKQLVMATGMSGKAKVPEIPGPGRLQGRAAPLLPAPRRRRLQGQDGPS